MSRDSRYFHQGWHHEHHTLTMRVPKLDQIPDSIDDQTSSLWFSSSASVAAANRRRRKTSIYQYCVPVEPSDIPMGSIHTGGEGDDVYSNPHQEGDGQVGTVGFPSSSSSPMAPASKTSALTMGDAANDGDPPNPPPEQENRSGGEYGGDNVTYNVYMPCDYNLLDDPLLGDPIFDAEQETRMRREGYRCVDHRGKAATIMSSFAHFPAGSDAGTGISIEMIGNSRGGMFNCTTPYAVGQGVSENGGRNWLLPPPISLLPVVSAMSMVNESSACPISLIAKNQHVRKLQSSLAANGISYTELLSASGKWTESILPPAGLAHGSVGYSKAIPSSDTATSGGTSGYINNNGACHTAMANDGVSYSNPASHVYSLPPSLVPIHTVSDTSINFISRLPPIGDRDPRDIITQDSNYMSSTVIDL